MGPVRSPGTFARGSGKLTHSPGRGEVIRLAAMAEEMRPESPFGLQGAHENIWHIARAERWSDGQFIGHRTFCGRNYAALVERRDLDGLDQVCSDCEAQVSQSH